MTTPEADDRGCQPLPAVNPFADGADKSGDKQMPLSSATLQQLPWAAALVILVLCGIVNVSAAPFGEHMAGPPEGLQAVVFSVGLGIIGGQIGGLSAVLVWSQGSFIVRSVVLWLAGMLLYACWAFGLLVLIRDDNWLVDIRADIARAIAVSLPLISLAVQLPQWLARFYFGWRIETPGQIPSAVSPGLSIRDLMVGTAVVALTITAVRFSLAADEMTTDVWVGWAIAVGILGVVSAFVMLPLLVLVFRSRPLWALLYILVGSPLLAGATMYAIVLVDGASGGPDTRAIILFLMAATSCVAATSAPLWLARWAGYRLKFAREE